MVIVRRIAAPLLVVGVVSTIFVVQAGAANNADQSVTKQAELSSLDNSLKKTQAEPTVSTTSERLNNAVKEGRLSSEQAAKITAKQADITALEASLKQSFTSMTKDQRTAKIAEAQAGLDAWAVQNNVPDSYVVLFNPYN